MRRTALIGSLCVIGVLALVYMLHTSVRESVVEQNDDFLLASLSEMVSSPDQITNRGTEVQRFAFKKEVMGLDPRFEQIPKKVFEDSYETLGPNAMVAVLDEEKFCHSRAHNLGRVIYDHTKDLGAASSLCQGSCSGGCVHGVLMSYFDELNAPDTPNDIPDRHVTIDDLTPEVRDAFSKSCENSTVVQYLGVGSCYHAVGHALVTLADYEMDDAIELCSVFKPYGPGAVYYCITGAYMERSIVFGKSDFETPGNDLYPCDTSLYPAACFRYKMGFIVKGVNSIDRGLQVCKALSGSYKAACYHGVGFSVSGLVYSNLYLLSTVCTGGTPADERMCLEGVLGLQAWIDRSGADDVCGLYTGDRAMCFDTLKLRGVPMSRNFTPYMSTTSQ